MRRSTIALVAAVALSTAAAAQVGTTPVENKIPAPEASPAASPTRDPVPPTDDAAPADRADAPATNGGAATVAPATGDSAGAPPPK